MTPWSRQCLRQADAVLIVANGTSKPTIGLVENQLNNYSSRAIKILVLLHKATSKDSLYQNDKYISRIFYKLLSRRKIHLVGCNYGHG